MLYRKLIALDSLTNPVDWWKSYQVELPTLAAIASYLAVQATLAPSERNFSAASCLITGLRNNLDPETVKNLLCINCNWEWYKDFGAIPDAKE
jgi:hAT family C-terminal dimerisation region